MNTPICALFMPPTRDVLRGLEAVAAAAPENLSTISFLMPAPPAPFIPEAIHRQPTLAVMFVFDGDVEAGQAALEPFRRLATPMAELVMPMPYVGIYEMLKDAEQRTPASHRSLFLETLDDAAVDTILERMAAPSSPVAMTQIRILGGAMARVGAGDTAFAHRAAPVMVTIITPFEDMAEAPVHAAWTHAFYEALRPRSMGVYSTPRGRGRGAHPGGVSRGDVPAPGGRQAPLRSDQRLHRNQNIAPAPAM